MYDVILATATSCPVGYTRHFPVTTLCKSTWQFNPFPSAGSKQCLGSVEKNPSSRALTSRSFGWRLRWVSWKWMKMGYTPKCLFWLGIFYISMDLRIYHFNFQSNPDMGSGCHLPPLLDDCRVVCQTQTTGDSHDVNLISAIKSHGNSSYMEFSNGKPIIFGEWFGVPLLERKHSNC